MQCFTFKVSSREITVIGSKGEQTLLHVTHRLDLIHTYAKCYQNISKVKKVMKPTIFPLQTDTRLIAISPNLAIQGVKNYINRMGKKTDFSCV